LRSETRAFRDACEHARADFLRIVKGEDEVRPTITRERFVGTGLSLDLPANPVESGEHTRRARGRPIGHEGAALRSAERHADEIRAGLGMLQAIGKDAQGESLRARDGLVARLSVGEDAGEIGHLGDPAAVLFAIRLNGEMHNGKVVRSVDIC